jgi:hypothetical protein
MKMKTKPHLAGQQCRPADQSSGGQRERGGVSGGRAAERVRVSCSYHTPAVSSAARPAYNPAPC